MKTDKAFHDRIMQVLSPYGITSRAMFGGYGLYLDKVMVGALIEDELYLRVDETTKSRFEEYQSHPFVYEGSGKPVTMPYMTLPDEIFHNPVQLKEWLMDAYAAAVRRQASSKKKKR
jgi:DNA transformation protein and related proteins